jgi:hypothetical protein
LEDERDLFTMISEQGPEFSLEEYRAVLQTSTPSRPKDSGSAVSTLENLFHQFDASSPRK